MTKKGKALEGIKVLDMTQFLAGPYCGSVLADMGADVIKIETPSMGDFVRTARPQINNTSIYYENMNRGKKSVTLNLKTKEGKEIFRKLIAKADVLIENNRPGVMERLGFSYEQTKEINDRLIYCSISGFGQSGPYSDRPGYDLIGQAMAGAMSITGMPGQSPLKSGIPLADVLGGMNGAIGILGALNYRNQTGKGQQIDVSLVDSIVSSMRTVTMPYLVNGTITGRSGNRYQMAYPYDSFQAKDGEYVVACGTDPHFAALAEVMGMPELVEDVRFKGMEDRKANAAELKAIIEKWSSDKTADECVELILKIEIPVGPIYDIKQVVEDKHIHEVREMFVEVEHPVAGKITITGSPIKMSETPTTPDKCASTLGADNAEIYGEIGLDIEIINEYKAKKII